MFKLFLMVLMSGPSFAQPFWKVKPEAYRKITEERRVIVSVTDLTRDGQNIMSLKGGGQIHVPKDVATPRLLDFKNIFNNSRYIKKITVDEKHRTLFVRAVAYGFSNAMKINWTIDKNEDDLTQVSFKISAGLMEGFKWTLMIESAENGRTSAGRTEVGIDGEYEYDKFPLPAFFLKFGLEVIFQQVAIDLRANVEEHFKKQNGGSL